MAMEIPKVRAPFTDAQVDSINGYQQSGFWHPFTCGAGCEGILLADNDGMTCPECEWGPQRWAHEFMANGLWRNVRMFPI